MKKVLKLSRGRVQVKYNPYRAMYEIYVDRKRVCRNYDIRLACVNAEAFAAELQ